MIASLSAGSNITGVITDVRRVTQIVKKYNGLVFFDYAGTGPYEKIDLSIDFDGIYISPHKFLGGPGSCGITIFKNSIYNNRLSPTHGGGGTVSYVNKET